MIADIARVVSCLAAGEVLARFMPIVLPAPIIGLLLLFAWLMWRGTIPQALGTLADQMLGLFGLFFVPAGVGVVAFRETLQVDFLAITLAVTAGTLVTIAVTAATAATVAALAARNATKTTPKELRHGRTPTRPSPRRAD